MEEEEEEDDGSKKQEEGRILGKTQKQAPFQTLISAIQHQHISAPNV